ncbi:MAG TPA: hypothetical protein VMW87_08760 [Spirochaetia bacterium]|nr:hypothetical protein [Spirochaetia bacterium]
MFASERFRRRVNRTHKELRTAGDDEVFGEISRAFDASLSSLPQDMHLDLFAYLMERFESRRESFPGLWEYTEYLGDVIDLLTMGYDERRDPLLSDDWEYLRDTISDYAVDLDMDLVNYVLQFVVSKGYLG